MLSYKKTFRFSNTLRILRPAAFCLIIAFSFILKPQAAFAQVKIIRGIVTDSAGNPLRGINYKIKDGKWLGMTNADGQFTLKVPQGSTLVFSSVNYLSREVTIDAADNYPVEMLSKSSALSDVVVIGYGSVNRKDLTGAVGSVNMKDMEKAPVKSFDDALAGRVAGVTVQSSTGQPGDNANIVIRGAGSITQDQSPLYVVDGYPMEDADANSIPPDDIASIDILKDASATAIYGARGANGVVLITTKRGKTGSPMVSYNAYYGLQSMPKKVKMMTPYQFVSYVQDLGSDTYDSAWLSYPTTLDDYKNVKGVDMQNMVFRTGSNQNHDLSMRGGNDMTKYSVSLNYNNQSGIIINTGFKRLQGRFSLDQQVSKNLKAGVTVNYSYAQASGPQVTATNYYASSNILYSVWGWRPVNPIGDSTYDQNLATEFYDPLNDLYGNQDYRVNPYVNLSNIKNQSGTTTIVVNGYAEYAISPKLRLRIQGGITQPTVYSSYFNDSLTQSGSKWNSSGTNGGISTAKTTNWLNQNTLTYDNTFGSAHHITAVAGTSVQGNNYFYNGFSANQLPNPELGLDGLDLADAANTATSISHSTWKMISGFFRINYAYKSKYLVTASMRADGSSKFPKTNRWGYFPSAAVAWNFNKEHFAENWEALSTGKLRVGFGASGNNRVSDFAYLTTLTLTDLGYSYSWNNQAPAKGAVINTAGNSDLKWETSVQTNIGLDLGFINDRIMLTADIYKRDVNNLLLNASLPYDLGIPSATGYKNVGKLTNKGLEITLNTINIQHKHFLWSTNFNIAFNSNKIVKLTEGQNSLLSGSGSFFNTTYTSLSPYISKVGGSVGEMYGLIFNGVYQYSDFNQMPNGSYVLKSNVSDNGTGRANVHPGDIKYKDINGDGTINNEDYTVIGRGLPLYTGGLSNNFTVGRFDLNVLLQWSVGNDVINANRYLFEGAILTNPNLNQYAAYANRWTPDNPSNTMFRAGGFGNAAYSSRVIENGSYLKVRTVSLGYNVPSKALNRIKIKNIRVYASAQNLLTITGYSGQDPEASSRQSNLTPGFDYSTYPHSLSVVMGLNVTF